VVLGYSPVFSGLLLLAMNGGDLVLKTAVTRAMRRFGFRSVLIASAAGLLATVVGCATFSAATPYWAIFALLAAGGMARSLLFSGMGTLAFADVPHEELGSATVLWNLVIQVTNALGVSLAAILMNVTSWSVGEPMGHVTLRNCQVALIAMALIGSFSLIPFWRLPRHAGALVSGHRPQGLARQNEG